VKSPLKTKSLLPKLLGGLALTAIVLLAASAVLRSEPLQIAGSIVLALFGILVAGLIFGGLFIGVRDRKKGG
jgi:Na+/H+-dicarboxylate symporter